MCSKFKVMLSGFFNDKGTVHNEYVPRGQAIN
jgi:hypothetical protein